MEQRNTRQREAIMRQLGGRTDHPTAETLYTELKPEWPHLSLGTVYRNLAQLCQSGRALKVTCESGADHYDADTSEHCHLQCVRCGAVCDVPASAAAISALPEFQGEIHGVEIRFTGLCPACKPNKS